MRAWLAARVALTSDCSEPTYATRWSGRLVRGGVDTTLAVYKGERWILCGIVQHSLDGNCAATVLFPYPIEVLSCPTYNKVDQQSSSVRDMFTTTWARRTS